MFGKGFAPYYLFLTGFSIWCEWWTTKATKAHSTSIRRKIYYEQCGTHSYLKYKPLWSRIAYSQLEEINTALCAQKLAVTSRNEVPLPDNILPYINTTLAWDNINRLEETLSGEGTSHRVNGIAVQANQFGPHP